MAFFQAKNLDLIPIADYMTVLSAIAFLWFVGSLWAHLQAAEGDPGFLAALAAGSGLLGLAVLASGGGWALALFRIEEGLSPELARYLFDMGNYSFANLWVFSASMLLASGLAGLQHGSLPAWLCWLGLADAVGLLLVRAVWASPSGLVFMPYALFWVWLISASVVLLRRGETLEQRRV